MTRNEWEKAVRIACFNKGETLVSVAKGINYSTSHIRKVASGCTESKRAEDAISNYLGIGIIDERK